ncbi:uncharacterized protein LOC124656343 [Lolium rigidum]|uniref:uncharacterized protein LOC124656343 n=1 Tax=Lolium rigidum TaxID=89674 RepID=UPI001F5D9E21|nr:uncharacterized protein LOC124656343 [Lolium rigidum]
MATRLLLSLLLLLAVSTVRGAAAAAGGSPSWCVCRPDASDEALQSTLDYACGNGADCAPLHAGAQCHSPDTLVAHCSYAANSYFHRISQTDDDATCDFGGAATLSETDPSSETCTYPATAAPSITDDSTTAASPPAASWCVCKPGLSDAALQGTLDYACGHGADCNALRPGGQCHDPDTLLAHCSYAANSYFQSSKDAACDFAGTAALSSTDPSSGTCKYTARIPEVGKMPLWFFAIALTVLVLYILLLCIAERPSGSSRPATVSGGARVREETGGGGRETRHEQSSTRATVSGGARVREETGTSAAAAAERLLATTCTVCLEACTNQGLHRVR